jgi:hypothetical protein
MKASSCGKLHNKNWLWHHGSLTETSSTELHAGESFSCPVLPSSETVDKPTASGPGWLPTWHSQRSLWESVGHSYQVMVTYWPPVGLCAWRPGVQACHTGWRPSRRPLIFYYDIFPQSLFQLSKGHLSFGGLVCSQCGQVELGGCSDLLTIFASAQTAHCLLGGKRFPSTTCSTWEWPWYGGLRSIEAHQAEENWPLLLFTYKKPIEDRHQEKAIQLFKTTSGSWENPAQCSKLICTPGTSRPPMPWWISMRWLWCLQWPDWAPLLNSAPADLISLENRWKGPREGGYIGMGMAFINGAFSQTLTKPHPLLSVRADSWEQY